MWSKQVPSSLIEYFTIEIKLLKYMSTPHVGGDPSHLYIKEALG